MNRQRLAIAGVIVALAALAAAVEFWRPDGRPVPTDGFSLRGKFIGSEAAADAAAFAGVCGAVADALELDGKSASPRISNGVQLEDIRTATSEARFLPRPLRERQPHVREAVGKYLDETAGTSGKPMDPTTRARWVASFREIQRAAEEAVR